MERKIKEQLEVTKSIIETDYVASPSISKIINEQRELYLLINKSIKIFHETRPKVSPRYFAACCVILNDGLISDEVKLNILVLSTVIYSSLTQLPVGQAYKEICYEISDLGIQIPAKVREQMEHAVLLEYDKIASIYELL